MFVNVSRVASFGLFAAAVTLSLAPQQATALPSYKLTKPAGYQDYTVTIDGPTSATDGTFQAGPFQLTNDSDASDSFIAWCFDLIGEVSFGQSYKYQPIDFLEQPQRERVQTLFDASYHLVDTSPIGTLNGQGFQLAVWNAIYDIDFDISDGDFKATASNPTGVIGKAQEFATLAQNYGNGPTKWIISELQVPGTNVQKLGTATAIPLPAAAWLLLAVSGGLIAAKRRRADKA